MSPWYATNARTLLDARRNGMVPAGPVVVSLVGGEFDQTALYVRPDMPMARMDWRMLVNLDVWVWANAGAALDWVLETTLAIARARPSDLYLRFQDPTGQMHDVAVGRGFHHPQVNPPAGVDAAPVPALHDFHWCPINVGGSALGNRLQKALKAKQKAHSLL